MVLTSDTFNWLLETCCQWQGHIIVKADSLTAGPSSPCLTRYSFRIQEIEIYFIIKINIFFKKVKIFYF